MSKRDRAERAKNAAESTDEVELDSSVDSEADSAGETGSGDTATVARPSGKRSPRGKRPSLAKDDDGDDDAGSAVATKEKTKDKKTDGKRKRVKPEDSRNPFIKLWVFLTQVVSELKKVIWPTRKQLIQYTIIVLIFVIIMVAFISALDLAFAKAVLWLFG
ncbi:preprotein translocase subunit SecE [Williamsia sp. 1135]|uniref:preprotein translocase subunit SecE n=1 Tax=Williamsia sp. 1135 TaxID=1889262 RepID=UPI000A119C87|nr:preprotein translocase subunit SecE [Williamsia sp. 1135]ORM32273.1 preprotein translocase subunit SecE [Williamsia sp. 1135]